MWFAILTEDVADSSARRASVRPDHLARLQTLVDDGRLLVAGPHPAIPTEEPGPAGFTGSLVIAEFESLAAAEAWASEDPYVAAGVYADGHQPA